jgi:hypothetical protein
VSLLPHGDDVYVTIKQPVTVPDDARPYAAYSLRRIDLSDPMQPTIGPAINVPGELLSIQGTTLFTRDRVWGDQYMETAISRLELQNGLAYLQNNQRFEGRNVTQVVLDEQQMPLVVHGLIWIPSHSWTGWNDNRKLSLLAPAQSPMGTPGFDVLSESRMPGWATLIEATQHRALFETQGGMLVLDIDDPLHPQAQAYFPAWYWSWGPSQWTNHLIDANEILFAGGPFGIHQLGLDDTNLLPSVSSQ